MDILLTIIILLMILHLTYCVLVYCLLGCSPTFNRFVRDCKQFITNEWRNDYV